ncbi:MAG: hypothetical protein HY296_04835 [Thaumarchaeota archaeon]|nr:hypothetical protein [Nitrososphaerota archaeon]
MKRAVPRFQWYIIEFMAAASAAPLLIPRQMTNIGGAMEYIMVKWILYSGKSLSASSAVTLMMTEREYKVRLRLGDAEMEIVGDQEFVSKMSKEFEFVLKETPRAPIEPSHTSRAVPSSAKKPTSAIPAGQVPATVPGKLEALKDEGYYSEPKEPSAITEEFRNRGWGVYKTKDISSTIKRIAGRIGLRRVPLGEGKYGYTFP